MSEKNKEKGFLQILAKMKEHARKSGFKLNDKKIVEAIITGLIKKKEKCGEHYCPCRVVTEDKEEDKKIVCPCIYHKDEIKKDGKCLCGLFVKK